MLIIRTIIAVAACLLLAVSAHANDDNIAPLVADVAYKGIVGKALDAVPMDPNERVVLQRSSAVISGTLTGRSLAVWAGLTNPVLLVAGLVWGIYSATNIKPAKSETRPDAIQRDPPQPAQVHIVLLVAPPLEHDAAIEQ